MRPTQLGGWVARGGARRAGGAAASVVVAAALIGACSSSSSSSPTTAAPTASTASTSSTTAEASTSTTIVRPAGPAASITGPITGGTGPYLASVAPTSLNASGYVESEYFASGTAYVYVPVGELAHDGKWTVRQSGAALAYRTRIVVRRPVDAQRFNGTVLVEWLNVSGGLDAAPDFSYMSPELLRAGFVWVGVSAQQIGVSGGTGVVPVPGVPKGGLRGIDPARYASLHHPGDLISLDLFSQIGRAVRSSQPVDALGGLHPARVVAIGESQSAFELTTYIDAVQPVAHVFDGFFVHSRGGGAIPLGGGNIAAGINGAIRIRDDVTVPVLMLETETDETLLHYADARQPDTAQIRLWDVAGAAHADAFLVGGEAGALGCKGQINTAQTHYVVEAALDALDRWMRTGTPPPPAPRMELTVSGGSTLIRRDALGNAVGGIRMPSEAVPTAALSGAPADQSSVLCSLFGNTTPFSSATLARLYPTRAKYLAEYQAATDASIRVGYVLAADRAALLAEAAKVKL